jgi:SagB-type dehydrogenase family enzyme
MSYHKETYLTYLKLQKNRGFLDYTTQVNVFKEYPRFYPRIAFDEFFSNINAINREKKFGNTTYSLRTVPSAGGLYPSEIYIQIRGVDGYIDGIYHYEVKSNSLVRIEVISNDGVEPFLNLKKFNGFIFLISSSYFRSSWKYNDRSFRYCLLDVGHILGSLEFNSIVFEKEMEFRFDFDKEALNSAFNFEDKEFFISSVLIGKEDEESVKELRGKLPFVLAGDYFIKNQKVYSAYQESLKDDFKEKREFKRVEKLDNSKIKKAIESRFSIRCFEKNSISKDIFSKIYSHTIYDTPNYKREDFDIFYIINRVDGLKKGLYKNANLIKEGDFKEKAKELALYQDLAKDCSVLFFITSKIKNYQVAMAEAGVLGHRIYIYSHYYGIYASGLGAFFDIDIKKFLECENEILYLVAIGV